MILNVLRFLPGVEAKINYSYAEALLSVFFSDFRLVMLLNLVAVHTCDIRFRICLDISTRKEFDPGCFFEVSFLTYPALDEFPAPGQLSNVKSRPPGNFLS